MYMRAAVSARDGFACAASSRDAASEWRRYLPVVENAMLRAAGMYPCPSPACTKNDILLFIPPGKTQAAEDTECESCGLHICTTCTRTAGKVVAFHAPFPCAKRVAVEGQLSAIQAGMQRANEHAANQRAAAVQREREESEREAAVRHIPRRHIPVEREKKRREHSPTTKRALANYEFFHGLPAGKASVDQVHGLGFMV
jgi:hypothetical protein